uniref:Uncharacterized protein n=1 Tax=Arundo donax TaxID=35708 RepID=A0A0A9FPR6_ARUDO
MATAVPAASLPLPRRASSSASAARRSGPPPLRKRHCAARPVSAAYSTPPPRQLDNGCYPAASPERAIPPLLSPFERSDFSDLAVCCV